MSDIKKKLFHQKYIFRRSEPQKTAHTEVIPSDGKTVTVTKPSVCLLSI